MMEKQPFVNKFVVSLLLAGMLFAAGYALRHTVSLVLLSFVLAYIFDPLVVYLERKKNPTFLWYPGSLYGTGRLFLFLFDLSGSLPYSEMVRSSPRSSNLCTEISTTCY